MAGRLMAKAVMEVDNPTSDTETTSGSYIEVEVDSDGNEIVIGTTNEKENTMTATIKTTSASVGGNHTFNISVYNSCAKGIIVDTPQ